MSPSTQVREIEMDMETAKHDFELAEVLGRLQKNPDFKALVQVGYFEEEATKVAISKAIPQFRSDASQKIYEHKLIGIGEFYQWLTNVELHGQMAAMTLKEGEEARDEILNEE